MAILLNSEKKLAVLWSPKAGCTFVSKWFFDGMGLLDSALSYNTWIHRFRMDVYYPSAYYHKAASGFNADEYLSVKVVRNPYTRTVSSYLHALATGVDSDKLGRHLKRNVKGEGFSFREFITYLEAHGVRRVNPHFSAQVRHVEVAGNLKLNRVIHLENSHIALQEISQQLALPTKNMEVLNQSSHHIAVNREDRGFCGDDRLPTNKSLLRGENMPTYSNFYDDELRRRVAGLFHMDFKHYGYDPSAPI